MSPAQLQSSLPVFGSNAGVAWPWQAEPSDAEIYPLYVSGGILFGGQTVFNTPVPIPGSTSRSAVAALDSTTGALLDWKLPLSQFGGVNSLAADEQNVYLASSGLTRLSDPMQVLDGFLRARADTGDLENGSAELKLTSAQLVATAGDQVIVCGQVTSDPSDFSHLVVSFNRDTGATNWVQTVDQFIWDLAFIFKGLVASGPQQHGHRRTGHVVGPER